MDQRKGYVIVKARKDQTTGAGKQRLEEEWSETSKWPGIDMPIYCTKCVEGAEVTREMSEESISLDMCARKKEHQVKAGTEHWNLQGDEGTIKVDSQA